MGQEESVPQPNPASPQQEGTPVIVGERTTSSNDRKVKGAADDWATMMNASLVSHFDLPAPSTKHRTIEQERETEQLRIQRRAKADGLKRSPSSEEFSLSSPTATDKRKSLSKSASADDTRATMPLPGGQQAPITLTDRSTVGAAVPMPGPESPQASATGKQQQKKDVSDAKSPKSPKQVTFAEAALQTPLRPAMRQALATSNPPAASGSEWAGSMNASLAEYFSDLSITPKYPLSPLHPTGPNNTADKGEEFKQKRNPNGAELARARIMQEQADEQHYVQNKRALRKLAGDDPDGADSDEDQDQDQDQDDVDGDDAADGENADPEAKKDRERRKAEKEGTWHALVEYTEQFLPPETVRSWQADIVKMLVLEIPGYLGGILLKNKKEGKLRKGSYPETLAAEILGRDPELALLRRKLVPARVKEEAFWTEYFHQVADRIKGHVASNS